MKVGDCVKIKYTMSPFFDKDVRGLVVDIDGEYGEVKILWLNSAYLSLRWSIRSIEVCDFPLSTDIDWIGIAQKFRTFLLPYLFSIENSRKNP